MTSSSRAGLLFACTRTHVLVSRPEALRTSPGLSAEAERAAPEDHDIARTGTNVQGPEGAEGAP